MWRRWAVGGAGGGIHAGLGASRRSGLRANWVVSSFVFAIWVVLSELGEQAYKPHAPDLRFCKANSACAFQMTKRTTQIAISKLETTQFRDVFARIHPDWRKRWRQAMGCQVSSVQTAGGDAPPSRLSRGAKRPDPKSVGVGPSSLRLSVSSGPCPRAGRGARSG